MLVDLAKHKPNITLEFIDIQKDNYPKKLALLFDEFIKKRKENKNMNGKEFMENSSILRAIEKSILERFNLRIYINHSTWTFMAILPMYTNRHHIFLDQSFHDFDGLEDQKALLDKWEGKSGSVDLKNAKVYGVFTEYTHPVYFSIESLIDDLNLNSEELTAILLHEIGHLFNIYEYSASIETTNQVLAEVVRVMKKNEPKEVTITYNRYLDLINSKADRDLFTSGKSRIVIGSELFKQQFGYVKSQLQMGTYDKTANEAAADLFVSRMGFGKHLISGLNKIETKYGFGDANVVKTINVIFSVYQSLLITAAIIISVANPLSMVIFSSIFMLMMRYVYGTANRNFTYDQLKDRYMRIRQQLVNILKKKILNKADTDVIISQIYQLDRLIDRTKEVRTLFDAIADWIMSKNRDTKSGIELQQLLEKLAANDLFIKTAEFRNV